jgi:radical SAM superfamily enzyme YgiQ (UPF0313 family)
MKLLLIQPSQIMHESVVFKTKRLMSARMSLPLLASLTPPENQVEIIDEHFDEIPFDTPADLIGIGFMTLHAPRAYQIGDEFRKRGKKVVMGGIHASTLPEEALAHSDAVVVGEAEGIWLQVLEDFKNGKLGGIYRNAEFPGLKGLPFPRYDLLEKDRYRLFKFNFPIQAGRGCPFNCEFCSVTRFFGSHFRWRPVEEVVAEIQESGFKKIFFVDDNIIGNPAYARDLFKALMPLKLRWAGQASLNIARDDELLAMAAESGCGLLCLGVESITDANLAAAGKTMFKSEEISGLFSKIREQGILIRASIIFGLDDDSPDVFKKTAAFLIQEKAAYADFYILTPLPGTKCRRKLEEQGRILDSDWSHYDGLHVVFQPRKMKVERLEEGLWEAYAEFYSFANIFKRILGGQIRPKTLRTLLTNLLYRKIARRRRHPLYGE